MSENNEQEKVETIPPLPADKASVRLKLVMALLVGLVTATVACLVSLYSLRGPESLVCLPQRLTVWPQMWELAGYLDEYKKEHGTYPLTLEEMTSQWKGHDNEPLKEMWVNYRIRDGWKNPLIYFSDGETWELLSYGADGKPGGVGLDADIRCTSTEVDKLTRFNSDLYKNAKPTIKDKTSDPIWALCCSRHVRRSFRDW